MQFVDYEWFTGLLNELFLSCYFFYSFGFGNVLVFFYIFTNMIYDWCFVDIRNNNSGINPILDLCRYI